MYTSLNLMVISTVYSVATNVQQQPPLWHVGHYNTITIIVIRTYKVLPNGDVTYEQLMLLLHGVKVIIASLIIEVTHQQLIFMPMDISKLLLQYCRTASYHDNITQFQDDTTFMWEWAIITLYMDTLCTNLILMPVKGIIVQNHNNIYYPHQGVIIKFLQGRRS